MAKKPYIKTDAQGNLTPLDLDASSLDGKTLQEIEAEIGQATANDGVLTIQKNGTQVAQFSANQSGNTTANITVPTKTSDLTNDSNFITNANAQIAESQVTNLSTDLQNIRNVAEGKTKTYVIDAQSDITGTKDSNDEYTSVTAITGVTIANLKVGDNVLIKALNVPDYWVSKLNQSGGVTTSVSLNKLETTKVIVPTVNNATLTIQKNGTTIATFTANSSTNQTANISVPTALSDLSQNASYRTVTDIEKTTWNNKSNFSGAYNDLTGKPTLFSGNYNDLTNKPTSLPASDVYAWAKASTKPNYNFNEISNRYDTLINFSGSAPNIVGSVSAFGMAMSSEHGANRLAFINPDALTCEYSTNGSSWNTMTSMGNDDKVALVTSSNSFPVGRNSSSTEYQINSKSRLTITGTNASGTQYLYCSPKKMLINISSSGGMEVLVEYRSGTNTKNNGSWSTYGTYSLSGWSGWNELPIVLGTLGGGSSQTSNNWQLRLTFTMTSKNTTYPTTAFVNSIRLFADNIWSSPSTMASYNRLYGIDISQNAYFPNEVYANNTRLLRTDEISSWAKASTKPSYSYSEISGTPTIPTADSGLTNDRYVRFDTSSQGLTSTQKSNARTNIGAGTSNFTGYTSSNKLSTSYIQNDAGWTSNAGTVTSVRVQAGTGLSSSTSTAQTSSLNTTISIASGYKLPTTTEWNDAQPTIKFYKSATSSSQTFLEVGKYYLFIPVETSSTSSSSISFTAQGYTGSYGTGTALSSKSYTFSCGAFGAFAFSWEFRANGQQLAFSGNNANSIRITPSTGRILIYEIDES